MGEGDPMMVSGVAVASPYDHTTTATSATWTKGEKQPNSCRDAPWAILFWAHLGAMLFVVAYYGKAALADYSSGSLKGYEGVVYAAAVCGVFAFVLSGLGILVLMACAEVLIKISLFFVVGLSLAWAVLAFLGGAVGVGVLFLIFFLIGLCYIKVVWSRIPFATANLVTALTAVKSNFGITLVAYLLTFLALGWSVLWSIALVGVYDQTATTDANGNVTGMNYGYLFLLFISYFWTHQVIQNTIHVTTAGTVGTWWFSPQDASSCCSTAICGSFFRAITTSFGSICLGSLIVAIVQALRQLANAARQNDDGNQCLVCIAECILSCIESIIEYFNKWAYIYVGLYGYSYCQAGKNVMTLFHDRGWDAIITDDLVSNTLLLVSVVTGLITGCIGIILTLFTDWFPADNPQEEQLVAFM